METLVQERISPLHNHLHAPLTGSAYQKAMEDAQNGLFELQRSREFSSTVSRSCSDLSTSSDSSSVSSLSSPDVTRERHTSTIMPNSERMQPSKLMEVINYTSVVLLDYTYGQLE